MCLFAVICFILFVENVKCHLSSKEDIVTTVEESLCNVRLVVHLVNSVVGRIIFSSDSIFHLLLKTNS